MALKINRRLILMNLLVTAMLLTAIEIICRFVLYEVYNREFDSRLLVDNKYGPSIGMKANTEALVWGQQLHTDGYGWRKNKIPLSGKKKKWLFIGDSVTEGVGVADSCTFVSRCSEELKEFDVLNCSLIGYSTRDYWQVLTDFFNKQETSIELVTLCFCLNDVYGATAAKDLPVMAKQNWMGKLSGWMQNNYATYRLLKLFIFRNSDRYYQYDAAFYTAENAYFRSSMNYLRQCDSLCKANNVFLNVVLLPYRSQIAGKNTEVPQELVSQFCKANDIAVNDAVDIFKKAGNPSSLYLFADEIHFSAKGHQLMAEYLTR